MCFCVNKDFAINIDAPCRSPTAGSQQDYPKHTPVCSDPYVDSPKINDANRGYTTAVSSQEQAAITSLLKTYEVALNSSNLSKIISLYAPDGVLMKEFEAPSIGHDRIRATLHNLLEETAFNITLHILEIVVTGPDWAFARCQSGGTWSLKKESSGDQEEASSELFILQRIGADWKIARYCFNAMTPPEHTRHGDLHDHK